MCVKCLPARYISFFIHSTRIEVGQRTFNLIAQAPTHSHWLSEQQQQLVIGFAVPYYPTHSINRQRALQKKDIHYHICSIISSLQIFSLLLSSFFSHLISYLSLLLNDNNSNNSNSNIIIIIVISSKMKHVHFFAQFTWTLCHYRISMNKWICESNEWFSLTYVLVRHIVVCLCFSAV